MTYCAPGLLSLTKTKSKKITEMKTENIIYNIIFCTSDTLLTLMCTSMTAIQCSKRKISMQAEYSMSDYYIV